MGHSVVDVLLDRADVRLHAAVEHVGHAALGQDAGVLAGRSATQIKLTSALAAALADADVVIDFSTVRACRELLSVCIDAGRAAVISQLGAIGSPDPELTARALSAVADEAARLLLSDPSRYPARRVVDHARWLLFSAPRQTDLGMP